MIDHKDAIEYVQRHRALLGTKRADLVTKISAMTQEVKDIDIQDRQLAYMEANPLPLSEEDKAEATIRSACQTTLKDLAEFTVAEFIVLIKQKVPTAEEASIRSELSKAVDRGEATKLAAGNYRGGKPLPTPAAQAPAPTAQPVPQGAQT